MDLFADLTPSQRSRPSPTSTVRSWSWPGRVGQDPGHHPPGRPHAFGQGIGGGNILALTFTNKAAGEMKERIEALRPDSGVWVGTFHALCARLLRSYAPLVGIDRGFTIFDQSDRLRAVKDAMEKLDLEDAAVTPERIDSAISRAKNDLVTPEMRWPNGRATTSRRSPPRSTPAIRSGSRRARRSTSTTCSSTSSRSSRITPRSAELDARFRYVLVDEYQDTNLAQYAIVRALCVDRPNLCVTGDPDQSIYGWRGANLNNILEFEHDFPGCKVVKLEQNYRSTKNILRTADALIRPQPEAEAEGPDHREPGRPAGRADRLRDRAPRRPTGSPRRSSAWSARGNTPYKDVAVFCRVTALTRGTWSRRSGWPRSPTRSSAVSRSTSGRRSRTSCPIST